MLLFNLLFLIQVSAQSDIKQTLRYCCSKGLVKKSFCSKFEKKQGESEPKPDQLDILANIVFKIAEDAPDYEIFYPGQYQLALEYAENNNQNKQSYKKPDYYLKNKKAADKQALTLFKAGFLNPKSQEVLLKEIQENRLLHPYYVTLGTMLLVIQEEFNKEETLYELISLFEPYFNEKNLAEVKTKIPSGRANIYSIFGALRGYKAVRFKKPKSAESLMSYVGRETLFGPHKMVPTHVEQEIVMDSMISCNFGAYGERKMVIRFRRSKAAFEIACPVDWSHNPPKLLAQQLFRSNQFLSMMTQLRNDVYRRNERVLFVDAANITKSLMGKYGLEDISVSQLMYRLRPFPIASKGWWAVPFEQFESLSEDYFSLSNGWFLPLWESPSYFEENYMRSWKKTKIVEVIDSSGALKRYPPSLAQKMKREFTTSLFSDTISILNHFNLLAAPDPLVEGFETINDLYAEAPISISIYQFMSCISFNDFKVKSIRIEKTEDGKLKKLWLTFPENREEYSINISRPSGLYGHVISSTARLWKKYGGSKRHFYHLPNMGANYILYLTPQEAYILQEGLNYMLRPL